MTDKLWYNVDDCVLLPLKRFDDERGSLLPIEGGVDVPFIPQRVFATFTVPEGTTRGEHANLRTHEFLICLSGGLTVWLHDGANEKGIRIDRPDVGLIVPPTVWIEMRLFAANTHLLVLASHAYDPAEYIRDFNAFENYRTKGLR